MSRGLWFAMSASTRRSLTVLWAALFMCSLLLQYVSMAAPASVLAADGLKASTVQGFEIDGDLRSGNGGSNPGSIPAGLFNGLVNGDDWIQGASHNGVVTPDSTNTATAFLHKDATGTADTSAYAGGNKEDDTRNWDYFNNSGPNDKTDFEWIMAHARTNDAGTSAFAYLGATRISNNGSMVVDFELNKKPFKQFSVGPKKPDRSNGDLLISLEYANGGSNPIVTIYEMANVTPYPQGQTVDFVAVSDEAVKNAVRSATNFVALANSGLGDIDAFNFAEASIDLSALGISTACPGFSSGHIRSRTGGDPGSSQLKDAAPAFSIDLNNCGTLRIEKEDENGAKLGGATFSITPNPIPGGSANPLVVTDGGAGDPDGTANGIIVIDPAVPNVSYTVTETAAPTGYIGDPDPQSKTVPANGTATFTFVNTLGKLVWEKYGPDGTTLLGGATFEITPNPKTGTGTLTVVDNGANDDDATAGEFAVEDARVGTYSVCETVAPAGYILDTGCANVSVSAASPTGSITAGTFVNTLGSIEWLKHGPNGTTLLGGATFEVTPSPLTGTGSLIVVDDSAADADKTPGEFKITDARVGTYQVCETAAPSGYIMDPDCAEVTVSAATPAASIPTGTFVNTLGSIAWEKYDDDDALLGGATFSVDPDPSDGVGTMTVVDNGANDADPAAGKFKVINVPTGSYTITETAAPAGYTADQRSCTIVVSQADPEGDKVCQFVNTPIPPSISVVKTAGSSAASQVADGATYTTEAFADNTVYKYVVTNTGAVTLLNVTLTDDNGTPGNTSDDFAVCATVASLAPSASFTCHATKSITADTTNIATAAGVSIGAGLPASDTDDAVVDVVGPAITVMKTAGGSAGSQVADGATYSTEVFNNNVTYAYLVTNTGEVTLNGITLLDDAGTASGADDFFVTCPTTSLAPGASMTCTATKTLVADRTNIATVTGFTAQKPDVPVTDTDDAVVVILTPSIDVVKTAGNAADGAVLAAEAGPITYTYVVKNDGPVTLFEITVTDDNGTPADTSDDFTATCPKSSLAAAESMTCSATVTVTVDTTNVAVARGVTINGNQVSADDDAKVRILARTLVIDKTNDAPLEELELPNGSTASLPTADEGSTVTYTLSYTFSGDPVTNAIITDVLPTGVTYVDGTATSNAQFTFQGYTAGTRTLTWTAPNLSASGSLSYKATVDDGAAEFAQPLVNVAAIDSDQTPRDEDDSEIFVPTIPLAETFKPTLPPTDAIAPISGESNPGFSLMLILLALAAVVLTVGFVTPVPSSVRDRARRR